MRGDYARREFPVAGYLGLSVTLADRRRLSTGDQHIRKGREWVTAVIGWPDRYVGVHARADGRFYVVCLSHPDASVAFNGSFGPGGIEGGSLSLPKTGAEAELLRGLGGGLLASPADRGVVSGIIITDRTRSRSGLGPQVNDRHQVEAGFHDRHRLCWFSAVMYANGEMFVGMPGSGLTLAGRLDESGLVLGLPNLPVPGVR